MQQLLSLLPPHPRVWDRRYNKLYLLNLSHTIYTAHAVEHIITSCSNAARGVVAQLHSTHCSFGFILVPNLEKHFFAVGCCNLKRFEHIYVVLKQRSVSLWHYRDSLSVFSCWSITKWKLVQQSDRLITFALGPADGYLRRAAWWERRSGPSCWYGKRSRGCRRGETHRNRGLSSRPLAEREPGEPAARPLGLRRTHTQQTRHTGEEFFYCSLQKNSTKSLFVVVDLPSSFHSQFFQCMLLFKHNSFDTSCYTFT